MAANPDINLSLNLKRFIAPKSLTNAQADGTQLVSLDENGLAFFTGGDVGTVVKALGFPKSAFQAVAANLDAGVIPQTLTLAYASMHLTAGMTVNLNYNFASADANYNDFAFAVLVDANDLTSIQPVLLADQKHYQQSYGGLTSNYDKLYTLLQGYHAGQHLTVDHTGDYRLLVGVADVSDKTGVSELKLLDVSLGIAGSAYSVQADFFGTAREGLRLSDGTLLDLDGSERMADGAAAFGQTLGSDPKLDAPADNALIGAAGKTIIFSDVVDTLAQQLIKQQTAAGGLLATQKGGVINLQAGGLASLTPTTIVEGVGVVPANAAGLIQADGASQVLIGAVPLISQDGGGLISQDGGGLIGQDGGGLISQDGGGLISKSDGKVISNDGGSLISQDGGGVISNDGGSLAASRGTATFVPNGRGGAGDLASTGNVASAIAFATAAAATRFYTLTADPTTTVVAAAAPVIGTEAVLSPAATNNVNDRTPALAGLSNGKYVSVWSDNYAFTDSSGVVFNSGYPEIRGQVFNADGTPSGSVLTVTPAGSGDNSSTQPSVTGLAGGRFVVTWTGNDLPSGQNTKIKAQFYNADGTTSGGRVLVGPFTAAALKLAQDQSTVASLFGGGAVVAYRVANSSGFTVLQGQLYAADGTAVGGAFSIGGKAGFSVTDQNPAAAGLQDGGFVVAYAESDAFQVVNGVTTETNGIYVQRFSSSGASLGAPVQVNTALQQKFSGLDSPAVAVLQDGSFVVTYRNEPSSNMVTGTILAQHFSASGDPLGGEITVATNSAAAGFFRNPDNGPTITALHEGGYAIGWAVAANSPAPATIFAKVFAADGMQLGDKFIASKSGVNLDYGSPAAVTLGDGRLLVAGTAYDSGLGYPGGTDIRAEAFSFPSTASAPTVSGKVVHGPVKGATVFADANGNGKLDAGEAVATTDALGRYTFTTPASGPVIATGGTDTYTGLAFTGTLTAPAGSLAVTALSTLVQKVMAVNGISVANALLQVTQALGLPLNTDLTTLNPYTQTMNGVVGAGAALVTDSVLTSTLALAQAAGATGDLYRKLALQIVFGSGGALNVTAASTLQGLGLSSDAAFTVSSLAKAGADLLAAKLADGTLTPRALIGNVVATGTVVEGAESAALTAATAAGTTLTLINRYEGANLAAQVDGTQAQQAGTPYAISYTDVDTVGLGYTNGDAYTGPVAGLQRQYIWGSTHKVAIGASTSNVFLHGGSGDDAISVVGGTNVLDGGAGSNFLVGATGSSIDTFFVDGRGGDVTWSTIVNFHAGDAATIFGFNPGVSTQPFTALDGIGGYQGLTIHSELGGAGTGVNASMTFAGIDQATADAHFTITSGTLGAGTASATGYLYIQYDH